MGLPFQENCVIFYTLACPWETSEVTEVENDVTTCLIFPRDFADLFSKDKNIVPSEIEMFRWRNVR